MIPKETVFADGRPVGAILVDTYHGQLSFHPAEGPSLLPNRNRKSLDEMRRSVIKAYTQKKEKPRF